MGVEDLVKELRVVARAAEAEGTDHFDYFNVPRDPSVVDVLRGRAYNDASIHRVLEEARVRGRLCYSGAWVKAQRARVYLS